MTRCEWKFSRLAKAWARFAGEFLILAGIFAALFIFMCARG